jgi:uncharacterized protein (DUF58 family)
VITRTIRAWFENRLPRSDSQTLTQRNLYILPTKAGWGFGLTLAVMLLASINYQLNLGYALVFLLSGAALVAMHQTHANLRRLMLRVKAPAPVFAGEAATVEVVLDNPGRERHGVGMGLYERRRHGMTFCDVPAQGSSPLRLRFTPTTRGRHALPTLLVETHFPLGLFRAWTVWRPAAQVLVYPAPEPHPPPLPPGEPRAGGQAAVQRQSTGEFDGIRAYRRGDPLKLVVWKKAAKNDELVSRDAQQVQRFELWLDLAHTGVAGAVASATGSAAMEQALSRLCAWVLLADKQGLQYGLRLGGMAIAPGHGEAHRQNCLQALALAPG